MLVALLLDRERYHDAIAMIQDWHIKDLTDPKVNFFLAMCHFLNGETDYARNLMQLVSKPHEWFRGLPDDTCAFEKLKLFTATKDGSEGSETAAALNTIPYMDCLEKLLTYGLPKLIFTFLDQV